MRFKAAAVWVLLGSSFFSILHAQSAPTPAPIEARVPFAPTAFVGSDGATHLAYELHLSNFYGDTGPLRPQGLKVYAEGNDTPLLAVDAQALAQMVKPTPAENAPVSIASGKRSIVFVWLTLPAGAPVPHALRHRIEFTTEKNATVVLDDAIVAVNAGKVATLGPPLRGGRWLANEGPGAAQSHHWGSLVAVNGRLTIPQRYALDLVGVDAHGRAIKPKIKDIKKATHADWVGYGVDVLAVADGVVRSARDGEEEHAPLTAQPEPPSLSADGLYGNYVILEIEPGVFASYAHLQRGSVKVKAGDRVRRGDVIGKLGQSGNSAGPHLHFHLADAATFEGSEGIPYTFARFESLGPETEAQLFGQGEPWKPAASAQQTDRLPLSGIVIQFPDR